MVRYRQSTPIGESFIVAPISTPAAAAGKDAQSEAADSTGSGTPAGQGPRSRLNWHDIEPILKWAAVAYGFGFLTVMFYTHSLGIPVLQLIEPVNIWIGAPLAIVAYFLDKLFTAAKRAGADFALRVREAHEMRHQLRLAKDDLVNLFYQAVDLMVSSLALFLAPIGLVKPALGISRVIVRVYLEQWRKSSKQDPIEILKSSEHIVSEEERQRILSWIGRILSWAHTMAAVYRFMNAVVVICLVPLFCILYIDAIYPRIPQSLGGGRPMSVGLLLSDEALPEAPDFRAWLPTRQKEPVGVPLAAGKHTVLIPVTLYFRTEHDLYVQKDSGPIVALSDHAIDGIVFRK